jgi:hypothetical protein
LDMDNGDAGGTRVVEDACGTSQVRKASLSSLVQM